ncbi:hypothetical protein JVU11DRAFT_2500 [Chiua virens]|nr:hypothetical protein JVU11DRAFT_2500 [Chiua virens]
MYNLWDTRGLGGGVMFFRTFFGGKSAKELKKFLKERHEKREIDLIVFCIRGSRTTKASLKYYNEFCAITRQLAAPVVLVVTHLERVEEDMEGWWKQNSAFLREYNMEFDNHACVTTLPDHRLTSESKDKLVDVITKEYDWNVERNGSYFGSRVRKSPPAAPVRSGMSSVFKPREDRRDPTRRHNSAGPSSPSTIGDSSFHTANGGRCYQRPLWNSQLIPVRLPPQSCRPSTQITWEAVLCYSPPTQNHPVRDLRCPQC